MSTAWGTATFFFEEVETTVGKKKFAVAKKKVAVAKKNFTPLLHKGVKSFFGAQRNAFSLTSSTLKVSKNAERCGTNHFDVFSESSRSDYILDKSRDLKLPINSNPIQRPKCYCVL